MVGAELVVRSGTPTGPDPAAHATAIGTVPKRFGDNDFGELPATGLGTPVAGCEGPERINGIESLFPIPPKPLIRYLFAQPVLFGCMKETAR